MPDRRSRGPGGRSWLPSLPTPLIGRQREVAIARQWLMQGAARLVTLTGAPGVGKTSLAVAIAEGLRDCFADGVRLVELAAVVDAELVAGTVADALGAKAAGSHRPAERLAGYLRGRDLLLVLDNFEQVLGAAPLVGELLGACPRLRVIVTSRAPLHLRREHELLVPPLELPESGRAVPLATLAGTAAVALFVERARAVAHDFALGERNARPVAELCRRLHGLPLAIELAAARARLLPPEAMLRQLESVGEARPALRLLEGGARDLPARQQTLRDAIGWSHALLGPAERELYRRLAVFAGGCTLDAAEAVCEATWDTIGSLVEKSLVRLEQTADGEQRLRMLETIRQHALEQLDHAGHHDPGTPSGPSPRAASASDAALLRERHAAFYLALAERAEPELLGPDQAAWLNRLEHDHENLRLASRLATERGDAATVLRLGAALWRFWWARSDAAEARERVAAVLALAEAAPPTPARVRALNGAGVLARELGEYESARALFAESLAVARGLDDRQGVAVALQSLGWLASLRGDLVPARASLEEGLAIVRGLGDRSGTASILHSLGYVVFLQGDATGARACYDESLAIARQVGDRRTVGDVLFSLGLSLHFSDVEGARRYYGESRVVYESLGDRHAQAMALHMVGHVAALQGDLATARKLYRQGLLTAREAGNRRRLAFMLSSVAALLAVGADPERAIRLEAAARAAEETIGAAMPSAMRALHDSQIELAHRALGVHGVAAVSATGQAMMLDEAVDEALAWLADPDDGNRAGDPGAGTGDPGREGGPPMPPTSPHPTPASHRNGPTDPLTRRERDVARLIARGFTNRQIASELVITEGTTSNYVQRVMNRLGFHTRAQIAAWAVEHGILERTDGTTPTRER